MCSAMEDRTARAIIRDEALRLYAASGPDVVTVRQIAAAAGVSPALVVHHFGSKEGLRQVVDEYVLDRFDAMLSGLSGSDAPDLYDPAQTGSLTELMLTHLPPGSPVPAYLRRLLLSDAEAGRVVFRRLFQASQGLLAALAQRGMAAPGADPAVWAALLMANDLAVLLLRDQLTDVLGVDPLSADGIGRWAGEMLAIYGGGLRYPAEAAADPPAPGPADEPRRSELPDRPSGGGR